MLEQLGGFGITGGSGAMGLGDTSSATSGDISAGGNGGATFYNAPPKTNNMPLYAVLAVVVFIAVLMMTKK